MPRQRKTTKVHIDPPVFIVTVDTCDDERVTTFDRYTDALSHFRHAENDPATFAGQLYKRERNRSTVMCHFQHKPASALLLPENVL